MSGIPRRSSVQASAAMRAGAAVLGEPCRLEFYLFRPSACTNDDGKLSLTFGKSGVTAQVQVRVKPRYLVFELAAGGDPAVDEAVLGGLAVDLAKEMSAAVAKMKRAIFTKLQGRVLVESSSGSWGD